MTFFYLVRSCAPEEEKWRDGSRFSNCEQRSPKIFSSNKDRVQITAPGATSFTIPLQVRPREWMN